MIVVRSVVLISALLFFWTPTSAQNLPRVHFFDVGQGDAILIQSPSGQNAVYDGGPNGASLLARVNQLKVGKIDLVIASHNHADHISGLAGVLERFRPRFYMDNGIPATTLTYQGVLLAGQRAGSQLLEPTARRLSMGDVVLQVLPPPGNPGWEQNDNSIGIIVEYGEFRLSLAGDAQQREWAWWLASHSNLLRAVHVHKASHHGSRNGDSGGAIERLAPKTVIVGVGATNAYGHPDPEALLLYRNATVYRTDLHGTVVVEADRSGRYTVLTERGQAPRPSLLSPVATPTSRQ